VSHAVQLFDSDDSLSVQVAAFLHRGYLAGEQLRLVATSEHMTSIAAHLGRLGTPVTDALATRRLLWMDAATMLQLLMPDRRIDEVRLRALARDLTAPAGHGTPTRMFGEMVDLLAAHGAFKNAIALESAWNRALAGTSISLLCSYTSSHFGDPITGAALHDICEQHDDVRCDASDVLGAWLIEKSRN
jgi:hypothetical protein